MLQQSFSEDSLATSCKEKETVTSVTCFTFPTDWGLRFPAKSPDPRDLVNSYSGLKGKSLIFVTCQELFSSQLSTHLTAITSL